MKAWLDKLGKGQLGLKAIRLRFDRSSGPGGQNVNKVNTKCTLHIANFSNCETIPTDLRQWVVDQGKRAFYYEGSDKIVVQSDETRSRENNKKICYMKLAESWKRFLIVPNEPSKDDLLKWEKLRKRQNDLRLKMKKYHSEKKSNRKNFD